MRFATTTLALALSFLTAASATSAFASSTSTITAAPTKSTGTAATSAVLSTSANFSEFNRLLVSANVKHYLSRASETYTVFAPSNEAIRRVPQAIRKQMFVDGNPALQRLVRTHMVAGAVDFSRLADGAELKTLSGEVLRVARQADGTVLLNGVYRVAGSGQTTANGVVYTLDSMIAPTN